FGHSKTIKNIIKLRLFYLMMFGFMILFLMGYYLQLISDFAFIWVPLFIVLCAIMTIYFAAQLSIIFNQPFKQIQANINAILNSQKEYVNDTFNIKEFQKLHNYLIHSVRIKEERDRIKNEFGILVAEVVHDLSSPLMELDFVVDKIRKNSVNGELASDVNDVDRLIKEIKSISASILTNYYQLTDNTSQVQISKISADDGNLPRFLNFPNLMEGLIESKKLEWPDNTCSIKLVSDDSFKYKFVYIAPTKILRALSNLINNSYQSLHGKVGEIIIHLKYVNDEYFTIIIEDTGCGISKEKINDVLSGESSKHAGIGIGIPSTLSYLKTINGGLSIESEPGKGTRIIINIPLLPQPQWFDETIRFNINTIFAVLDDDHNMILLWQKIFSRMGVKSFYFLNNHEFQAWYKDNKEHEIILLSDYDLKGDLTGLDIIRNTSVMKAYLVTHHAEEQWLQEKIEQTNIKLIPKYMIHDIKIVRF
ncbi:MAG TPA: HAMP domain-containing sensor histidine kinase, partial [Aquella sp.]|nr:HAMP domain-containing sensor histidine kinase [Aquella sp.]